MVRVIFGEKGAGNSKRIIQMANDSLDQTKGSVVFIDAEGQYLFELKHAIRFIDAGHYRIDGPDMFVGFIAGIAAQDFDLELVYVDGFSKLVNCSAESLADMFKRLDELSAEAGIQVIIAISGDEIPDYLNKYIAE
ncbi:MAG: twitching motility protein PilT [Clostridia bacterium]|nr:twitching motility protein PilT [Clostridia bacterium]